MKRNFRQQIKGLVLALSLLAAHGLVQAQTPAPQSQAAHKSGAVQPSGANQAVTSSGTPGQITKWTSASTLGDSAISEDKFGKVGIGTTAPTSRLTVQGMIETTLGGLKFPDGSVQMTAAVGGLQSIFHDATLTGNSTQASPLGIAVPLTLTGSASNSPIFKVINTNAHANVSAPAISATGGSNDDPNSFPSPGLSAEGGFNFKGGSFPGGNGIQSFGGGSQGSPGGTGITAFGGQSDTSGGIGVKAIGGSVNATGPGGEGVLAVGGDNDAANGSGGIGLHAIAGQGGNGGTAGDAGFFEGAVEVKGNFSVIGGGTKNFKIDHPLDPENKYLYHAAIESSEVLNLYSGNVTTDESGEATITLPDWFEAVNRDFRYQLTVIGSFAQAIVTNKIRGNRFTVKTNAPNVEVSWLVTSMRSDAAMLKHPFKVEEDKPRSERGSYLSPDAYDKPETSGVEWARNPQMMKHLKAEKEARARQQSKSAGDN